MHLAAYWAGLQHYFQLSRGVHKDDVAATAFVRFVTFLSLSYLSKLPCLGHGHARVSGQRGFTNGRELYSIAAIGATCSDVQVNECRS